LDDFNDDTFYSHPSFIGKTNNKSNDPDSLQEERLVFKRIPVNDCHSLEEFAPLERQYCTSFSIPKLPAVRYEPANSLSSDKRNTYFSPNNFCQAEKFV